MSLTDVCGSVIVFQRLREEKDIFVGSRRSIFHTLWHTVRFLPNNVAPEIPSCLLQGKRYTPRDPNKIFRFKPSGGLGASRHRSDWILLVRRSVAPIAAGVAVADI